MGSIKIDKNISIPDLPPRRGGDGRPAKYPWKHLKVGDSFILPAPNLPNARAHASAASIRYGKRFVVRKHRGEFRVWRTQ